jgi:dolichol-phosphate mannosyltransferase
MRKLDLLSIIVPCYNEEGNITVLFNKLSEVLMNVPFELIFIDDGSNDNSLDVIKGICDPRIKYISFSRNFGHQYALKAGLNYANGDIVISMDADMQHPPELINEMIQKWSEGYDIVYTIRKDKNTSSFKRFTSKFFYKIFNYLSNVKLESGSADFRLMDKKVLKIFKNDINEYYLFYRGLISWIGFESYAISYIPEKRFSGISKYSIKKMVTFSINGITAFSIKPLRIAIFLGAIVSLFAFLYGLYVVGLYFLSKEPVKGWSSLILFTVFLGGVNMLLLGIIGEYLGKLYFESKKRPHYIIKDSNIKIYE